jgi:hypothetical protein
MKFFQHLENSSLLAGFFIWLFFPFYVHFLYRVYGAVSASVFYRSSFRQPKFQPLLQSWQLGLLDSLFITASLIAERLRRKGAEAQHCWYNHLG